MSLPVIPLRKLLDEATPGPWEAHTLRDKVVIETRIFRVGEIDADPDGPRVQADAHLIALAPELASLCLDMGALIQEWAPTGGDDCGDPTCLDCAYDRRVSALLARLSSLGSPQVQEGSPSAQEREET